MANNFGSQPTSEDEILLSINQHFPNSHPEMLICRGDDCALFKNVNNLCVSSDLFLEDIHFRKSYFDPYEVGYKSLAVNISDIAACGAKPIAFSLSLAIPAWTSMSWLNTFFKGLAELSNKYNTALIGGDLSRSDKLHISISIYGEIPKDSVFLKRQGVMPNDILFIIGSFGLSRIGFLALEELGREASKKYPHACASFLTPTPQINAGLKLAQAKYNFRPPVLMDLSDGILRDLPRLINSGKSQNHNGAFLEISTSNLHPEILTYAQEHNLDPIHEALIGGEDYALLGACDPQFFPTLQSLLPEIFKIGYINESENIICNNSYIPLNSGFDHFKIK